MLYAVLTGEPPAKGHDIPGVLAHVLSSRPYPPPSESNRDVPTTLDAIALRCVAKEPVERFPTAESVGRALRDWLAAKDRSSPSAICV